VNALEVSGLNVRLGDLHILRDLDLTVPFGELHVLMGPNGSGKSTLCHALMGRPGYAVTGVAEVGGVDLLGLDVDGRAAAGLFEVFQYPVEIPGVTLSDLIAEMTAARGEGVGRRAAEAARLLDTEPFLDRSVNVGLSGGEKKRSEMTQLLALAPRMAVLDELDSGLDVDAVREVAEAVQHMRGPDLGVLVITHYTRVLRYLEVDRVHVMLDGRIVESGDRGLADRLDTEGYDGLRVSLGMSHPEGDSFLRGM
jgi:Fe-S cluster assembly ATP-binding protein